MWISILYILYEPQRQETYLLTYNTPSVDSYEPAHSHSLIRIADAQAYSSLCWKDISEGMFSHVVQAYKCLLAEESDECGVVNIIRISENAAKRR